MSKNSYHAKVTHLLPFNPHFGPLLKSHSEPATLFGTGQMRRVYIFVGASKFENKTNCFYSKSVNKIVFYILLQKKSRYITFVAYMGPKSKTYSELGKRL